MKILVLTNLFPSPWDPCRSTFNRQQFERLGKCHEMDVLVAVDFRERMRRRRGEVSVDNVRADHFVFWYPPVIGRSLHALCWLLSLLLQRGRRIRAAGYDCIIASYAYPDAVAAGWLARMLGVPYVVKVHGSDLNVQAAYRLRRLQIAATLRHAGAVVAVSQALADKAAVIGADPAKVHTLYNGVNQEHFFPGDRLEARTNLALAADAPLLLYVGNLKRSKGCVDLLRAFPAVLAIHPNARLVYVGTGSCVTELKSLTAVLGCAERVDFAGAVAHDRLVEWFRAADLLCLPSHNEGVPNVILEAMACGIPVVASRVGGIPEVLPEYAGMLVPPCQPDVLAFALVEACARAWDRRAIVAHAARFRWADNIKQLDIVVKKVVADRAAMGAAV